MIKSMTGFGRCEVAENNRKFTVEMKAVNHRYLDVNIKMPKSLNFFESAIRTELKNYISRGKVDVFINVSNLTGNDTAVIVNAPLAAEYKAAIDQIGEQLGISHEVSAYQLSRLPEVITLEKNELDKEAALALLMKAVNEALSDFNAIRSREGEKLCDDISSRLDTIEGYVSFIEQRSPQTVVEYRERLTRKMQEVLENTHIDESRILTEAAMYADRIAVDEETVRLRSHISQMRELLKSKTPVGRKLDFIVQELNRETNTIGSKCNDSEIVKIVLDTKSEIEKIREQVQNIE